MQYFASTITMSTQLSETSLSSARVFLCELDVLVLFTACCAFNFNDR